MRKHQYTAIVELDANGTYHAEIVELRGCRAQGRAFEEALANLRAVLEHCLEDMRSRNEPFPEPRELVGLKRIDVIE